MRARLNAPLVVIVMMAGAVDVTERVPHRIFRSSVVGKFVAEMTVDVDEEGGGLKGEEGVGVEGHGEDAYVSNAGFQY